MAPKKRGRRATAQTKPKEEEKPSSITAEEEPKEEETEDNNPLTKKAKAGRGRSVAKTDPDEKPSSITAEEEPKEEETEDNKPLTKKAKAGRGRSVAKTDPDEKKLSEEVKAEVGLENNGTTVSANKTREIIVEHCKQCQCFKVRASKVEKELKGAIHDMEVKINPEKPRRGCFEIRDGEGNIFLSLQNMPRPFTKLKQWDLDGTISEIIQKIK